MTVTPTLIATIVTNIQEAFAERPSLTLTARDAQRRFGAEAAVVTAVLELLVSAGVLHRRRDGAYVRFLPHRPAHAA